MDPLPPGPIVALVFSVAACSPFMAQLHRLPKEYSTTPLFSNTHYPFHSVAILPGDCSFDRPFGRPSLASSQKWSPPSQEDHSLFYPFFFRTSIISPRPLYGRICFVTPSFTISIVSTHPFPFPFFSRAPYDAILRYDRE